MIESDVVVRVEGRLGRLTLNRPRALNALTADMCVAVSEALRRWRDDSAVQTVLIDHAGERGFCAGGDVRKVAESGAADGMEAQRFFTEEYRMNELLFRYPKPVVAVMDGVTMGGGVGISAPARFRVATERTLWAMPEADIGLFPDVGGGWYLPRLPGEAGVWLAMTAARLRAADCCALGITTHCAPSERVPALAAALAEQAPEDALAAFAEDPGPAPLGPDRPAIQRLFAQDSAEAIVEALEADGSEWACAQLDRIAGKCPTTLKVALRLIRAGARRTSFAEEMEVEYRLAVRMTRRHDFIDGVRAMLVDRDNAPRWEPPDLAGVTDEMLDAIFAPLPLGEAWKGYPD